MSSRSINDVPKELVDEFHPRLKDAFNKVADYNKRIASNPNLAQDADFVAEVTETVEEIQNITFEFMAAGGSEDDFIIIAEDVAKDLPPAAPMP